MRRTHHPSEEPHPRQQQQHNSNKKRQQHQNSNGPQQTNQTRSKRTAATAAAGRSNHYYHQAKQYHEAHWAPQDLYAAFHPQQPQEEDEDRTQQLRQQQQRDAPLLVTGTLRVIASGNMAFVSVPGLLLDVAIPERNHRNRAFAGDTVVVELKPRALWKGRRITHADQLNMQQQQKLKNKKQQQLTNENNKNKQKEKALQEQTRTTKTTLSASGMSPAVHGILKQQPDVDLTVNTVYQAQGKVVAILDHEHRANATYVGTLHAMRQGLKSNLALFHPFDSKVPYAKINRQDWPGSFIEQLMREEKSEEPRRHVFEVSYGEWRTTDMSPPCTVVRDIGLEGTPQVEIDAIRSQHTIKHDHTAKSFSEAALREAALVAGFDPAIVIDLASRGESTRGLTSTWKVPEAEVRSRRDCRSQRVFSIDPLTARDLDDALALEPLAGGLTRIWVHIADVTHFVRPFGALDLEAYERATTVYLTHTNFPMLPRLLSESLCSLQPGSDRLTYSCSWVMNAKGEVVSTRPHVSKGNNSDLGTDVWYGRTIIHSAVKLNYDEAQLCIDLTDEMPSKGQKIDSNDTEAEARFRAAFAEKAKSAAAGNVADQGCFGEGRNVPLVYGVPLGAIVRDVRLLNRIAVLRRRIRYKMGSLSLGTPTLGFRLDPKMNPLYCFLYTTKQSNSLIEEYMLLANTMVARRISHIRGDAHGEENGGSDVIREKDRNAVNSMQNSMQNRQNKKDRKRHVDDKREEVAADDRMYGEDDFVPALLRRHRPPNGRGLEMEFKKLASRVQLDGSSSGALQKSIIQSTKNNPALKRFVEYCLTKPMTPAEYFNTADTNSTAEWMHYALSFNFYTHFTSPIRRYADIIVHRELTFAILGVSDARSGLFNGNGVDTLSKSMSAVSMSTGFPASSLLDVDVAADRGGAVGGEPGVTLSIAANHINEKALAAKKAGEQSQRVFLAATLRALRHHKIPAGIHRFLTHPRAFIADFYFGGEEMIIVTLYTPDVGVESRVNISTEMPEGAVAHVRGDENTPIPDCVLSVRWRPGTAPVEYGFLCEVPAVLVPSARDVKVSFCVPRVEKESKKRNSASSAAAAAADGEKYELSSLRLCDFDPEQH